MDAAKTLANARIKYPAREMKRHQDNEDQMRLMTIEDGMSDLEAGGAAACASLEEVDAAPQTREEAEKGRHLWVVGPDSVPVAPETCRWGKNLESTVIKHSNLTGGGKAHSGGEFWCIKGKGILVNAGSGRYGATTVEELDAFIEVARAMGCRVASAGFDDENPGVPNILPVGPLDWLGPNA